MKKIQLSILALILWQGVGYAACGYMPMVEVRNLGFSHIENHYDQLTLYCPKAFINVQTKDSSRQEGSLASNLLDDNKEGVCWLSGTRNGQQEKLLSFTAKLECKNKDENAWGKISVMGKVQYTPGTVCTRSIYSCQVETGSGLLVSVGAEPTIKDPMHLSACVCPVTGY